MLSKFRKLLDEWFPVAQKYLLLGGGLAGAYYETAIDHVDRPALLILFAGMMGLGTLAESGFGMKIPFVKSIENVMVKNEERQRASKTKRR